MRYNFKRQKLDCEELRDYIEDTEKCKYTNVSQKHYTTLKEIVAEYGNNIPISLKESHTLTYSTDLDDPMKLKHWDLADVPGMRETEEKNKVTREKLEKLKNLKEEQQKTLRKKHQERMDKIDALEKPQDTPPAET